jgi:mRNA interferase RelE/StbE
MSYELAFLPSALKEWKKLGATIRNQFKARLAERLERPHVESARLSGMPDCYKIKLRAAGYRLVYRVDEGSVTVIVIAVGQRSQGAVYKQAKDRL